jgi:hypothetical protein
MKCHQSRINELLPQLELYSEGNPDKFDAIRDEIIASAIASFPERYQQRAQGIQFTLDCELRKYKHPIARMNRMVEIFWQKFDEFSLVVNNPAAAASQAPGESDPPAKVISLF